MTTHVALLRAVNLGGHNKVAMADLRRLLTELGFSGVRSLLQSGNLVFDARGHTSTRLEQLLETAASERLGLDTEFFVRTAREWSAIAAGNPFPRDAKRDPARLLVMFLKRAPARGAVMALRRGLSGREALRARGKHVYIFYPDGIGRSRLTNTVIETRLGTRGTGRNWNTVRKLAALLGA